MDGCGGCEGETSLIVAAGVGAACAPAAVGLGQGSSGGRGSRGCGGGGWAAGTAAKEGSLTATERLFKK